MITIPVPFKERMKELLSKEDYQAFLESYEKTPKKGIRANKLKISSEELKQRLPEEFNAQPITWCREGFYIDQESRPGKQPEYYTGLYYPQEPSAMIPGEVINVEEGDLVLDLCAAPGGKSTQVAARLGENGSLVLNEIVKSRVGVLAENVERMGIKNAVILNENPARLTENFTEKFDKILVDAPCSGEGMFRKDNKVIEEWNNERPTACARKQIKILETVDKLLKPGGEIVYSTCTFAPEEDEELIEEFLSNYDYELLETGLNGIEQVDLNLNVSPDILANSVRLWPQLNEGEGHFVARLQKNGVPKTQKKRKRKSNPNLVRAGKKKLTYFNEFVDKYMPDFKSEKLYLYKDKLFMIPQGIDPEDLNGLSVVSAGLLLGELKKNRFEPSHALAMSLKADEFTNLYEMSKEELWDYLKGLEIKPGTEVENGWVLMCFEGYPVGFGKKSTTIKNKYPKGLRIFKK